MTEAGKRKTAHDREYHRHNRGAKRNKQRIFEILPEITIRKQSLVSGYRWFLRPVNQRDGIQFGSAFDTGDKNPEQRQCCGKEKTNKNKDPDQRTDKLFDFPLKSISAILSSPDYNKQEVIRQQKHLLTLKKQRLEKIISALDTLEHKGEINMKHTFDNSKFETAANDFKEEVKNRWGNTAAYQEFQSKNIPHDTYTDFDDIFTEFAACMKNGFSPSDTETQTLVKKLQDFITANFYTCTNEILSGLGQMYICDERFKNNINKHGIGTAEFVSNAIKIFCQA